MTEKEKSKLVEEVLNNFDFAKVDSPRQNERIQRYDYTRKRH